MRRPLQRIQERRPSADSGGSQHNKSNRGEVDPKKAQGWARAAPSPSAIRIARHTLSADAGIATSVTPSGASASTIAFITVGVAATVPPSPTPLMPSGLDKLGTGLKAIAIAGKLSARGML